MKQEIKFRAKRTDEEKKGQWSYGDLTHAQRITEQGTSPCVRVGGCNIDESTIGQYLGIKDVNGKEIYTGDIIEACMWEFDIDKNNRLYKKIRPHDTCTGAVIYFQAFFQNSLFVIKAKGSLQGCYNINLYSLFTDTMKIVGNIFDSPGMLTDKLRNELLQ